MKIIRETFPTLYARWVSTTWPILTGRPNPSSPIPQAAQVAADQEWEDEGGSIKPEKTQAPQPAPKIPF